MVSICLHFYYNYSESCLYLLTMNTKSSPPKKPLDLKRAKRFVDSTEEGDNLVSPLEQKEKEKEKGELIKTIEKP